MKLKLVEKVFLLLMFVACGFCCSRSTDSTYVRHSTTDSSEQDVLERKGHNTDSTRQTSSSTSDEVVGALDAMRFADDVVLQPDGGLASVDGGLPRVVAKVHREPTTQKTQTQVQAEALHTEDEGLDLTRHTQAAGEDDSAGEKKTKWGFLSNPLALVGLVVLAGALLFALYRFRRKFPFLNFIP